MAGYWIVRSSEITDQEAFDNYARLWAPVAEKYGARYVAGRGARHETREGRDLPRVLVIEFASYDQALACYDDADYRESLPYARKAYADRDLIIVESS